MRPFFTLGLAISILLLSVPPVHADGAAASFEFRYVGTPTHTSHAVEFGSMCTSREASVVVGGVCSVSLPKDGATVTIEVIDDVWGPTAFRWDAFTGSYPHVTCRLAGSGYGSVTVQLEPGCREISVFVQALPTTGIIRITSS